jgi:hypothetical protein
MKSKERLEFERAYKFQRLMNIRMGKKNEGLEPNPCWDGYEPIGLKDDGSPNCVPIKASKEEFVIPTPESGEKESDYINRCMGAIGSEYDTQEQALAVCYAQLK